MVKTFISSKGQTTIPAKYRARWKTNQVIWEELPDGAVRVRPVPDLMSLLGSAKSPLPRDPHEKDKARAAWGVAGAAGRRSS